MKQKILIRILLATALLILAIPVAASAQIYHRGSDDDRFDHRFDRRDVRDAITRLDNAGARLQTDLNTGRQRRVLGGLFWVRNVDTSAIAQVRDFRAAVRDLRQSSRGDFSLDRSMNEAREVLNRGVELDRYLRLRTGSTVVDADLADIRSNLHVIADAYSLRMPY